MKYPWENNSAYQKDTGKMTIVFIPSLVSLLISKEQKKGSALTEEEVIDIRDNATAIVLEAEAALQMVKGRGYRDINPDDCWHEWVDFNRKA